MRVLKNYIDNGTNTSLSLCTDTTDQGHTYYFLRLVKVETDKLLDVCPSFSYPHSLAKFKHHIG